MRRRREQEAQAATPGPAHYAPQSGMTPEDREKHMKDVVADHAKRIGALGEAWRLVNERLDFLDSHNGLVDPKLTTLESELVRVARDVMEDKKEITSMKTLLDLSLIHI